MRFLVYLITLLFVGIATAQNPTILQGNYITNVFGQANFVKNPNALINGGSATVNPFVTPVNATVTRSTTTPLVATTEFLVTTSTATGYVDWDTRTFDSGMKNQNCEARFTYRGFSVGSTTAQIIQGASTVVAQLTLTPSTDPRIASINFPCGDLSAATKFRLQQATASLTGTNEIGVIYVGLATNMANVAQAEFVGQSGYGTGSSLYFETTNSTYSDLLASNTYGSGVVENQGNASSSAPTAGVTPLQTTISNPKPGNYYVTFSGRLSHDNAALAGNCVFRLVAVVNGSIDAVGPDQAVIYGSTTGSTELSIGGNASLSYQLTTVPSSLSFKLMGALSGGGGACRARIEGGSGTTRIKFTVHRFPLASELVVKPETQNVFGGVVYTAQNQSILTGVAASGTYSAFNNATWNQPTLLKGKAQVTTTNSGNDLGFSIPNLPVGTYKVSISGLLDSQVSGTTVNQSTNCNFRILETTTTTEVARQVTQDVVATTSGSDTRDFPNAFFGVFTNTSIGTRNFRLEAAKVVDSVTGSNGSCQAYSNSGSGVGFNSNIAFLIEPLDQPSNSALYVQGPVLGAQTGAAIPEGYVNEFATREITDTSIRTQASPTVNTWYYPWTGELTLPAGNWNLCYSVVAQHGQTASTNYADLQTRIQNKTDDTTVILDYHSSVGTPGNITGLLRQSASCKPIAITASKVFRVGIKWTIGSGAPTVSDLYLRGDLNTSRLYAIRLN